MEKKDILFSVVFVFSLSLLLFFFGTSLTGYVVQSMHCEGGSCREICRFDSDCAQGEICCDRAGFGVCEESCISKYTYVPDAEVEFTSKFPLIETPGNIEAETLTLHAVLTIIAAVIGILYLVSKKKK